MAHANRPQNPDTHIFATSSSSSLSDRVPDVIIDMTTPTPTSTTVRFEMCRPPPLNRPSNADRFDCVLFANGKKPRWIYETFCEMFGVCVCVRQSRDSCRDRMFTAYSIMWIRNSGATGWHVAMCCDFGCRMIKLAMA